MPYLVEILLPVTPAVSDRALETVRFELTNRFGGVTVHDPVPADGLWKDGRKVEQDRILLLEVMTDELDRHWWAQYRQSLETLFSQDKIIVRALSIERL
ncbi:hypothetical protein AYO27_16820 [Rhizobium sp. GHKF11]|nr:hypothetical protein AYO27_16820 [Rhizobium sp. GHKF11]